jgi:hypothetical protein
MGFQEVLHENGIRNLLGKLNDPDEQCRQEVRVLVRQPLCCLRSIVDVTAFPCIKIRLHRMWMIPSHPRPQRLVRNATGRLRQVYTTLVVLTDKKEGAANCVDSRGVPMLVEKLKLQNNPVIEPLVLQVPSSSLLPVRPHPLLPSLLEDASCARVVPCHTTFSMPLWHSNIPDDIASAAQWV